MSVKRYAIVNGGQVIAVILWDAEAYPEYVYPEAHSGIVEHETAEIGWSFVQGVLTDPDPAPSPPPPPVLGPSDYTLTRRQIRAGLIMSGILDPDAWMKSVMAAIADPVARALALNDWANAPAYTRDHPLFNDASLIAAAGMTPAQVDALWMAAKDLPE